MTVNSTFWLSSDGRRKITTEPRGKASCYVVHKWSDLLGDWCRLGTATTQTTLRNKYGVDFAALREFDNAPDFVPERWPERKM